MISGDIAQCESRQSTWSLLDIRTEIEVCPKFDRMLLSLEHGQQHPTYRIHVQLSNTQLHSDSLIDYTLNSE